MTLAMVVSAALHLGILFGIRHGAPAPVKKAETEMIALTILPPQIKELEEEPDPTPRDDSPPLDLALPVPMQADLPAIARPEDFVQALDFSSLIEKPDLSQSKISVIPEHIRRGVDLREKIGVIFNIADLDRSPEPIVQPAPVFPFNLKREAIEGRVRVEFVVDTEGRVHNPFVVESTHPGFDEAAMTGVMRWKFRPGFKNGRKVNTRMQVPIVFKIVDEGY
jgi:protein TonB